MYENEDADQLRANSVTDQCLCSRFLDSRHFHGGKPINLILVTNIHRQARASQCIWQSIDWSRGGSKPMKIGVFYKLYNKQQYFTAVKIFIFRWNFLIFFLFLLKTLIVGTRLNRLIEAVLTSTHNLCFGAKIRKKCTPVNPSFTI